MQRELKELPLLIISEPVASAIRPETLRALGEIIRRSAEHLGQPINGDLEITLTRSKSYVNSELNKKGGFSRPLVKLENRSRFRQRSITKPNRCIVERYPMPIDQAARLDDPSPWHDIETYSHTHLFDQMSHSSIQFF